MFLVILLWMISSPRARKAFSICSGDCSRLLKANLKYFHQVLIKKKLVYLSPVCSFLASLCCLSWGSSILDYLESYWTHYCYCYCCLSCFLRIASDLKRLPFKQLVWLIIWMVLIIVLSPVLCTCHKILYLWYHVLYAR